MSTAPLVLAALLPVTAAASCSYAAVDDAFEQLLVDAGLPGGALLVGERDGLLHERYVGSYTADTVVPIASASKWLSAIRVAQLASRGVVDLDAPVADTLPAFHGDPAAMTLGQMFSHTAGYGDDEDSLVLSTGWQSLARAVDWVACCVPLPNGWRPGAQFAYGGVSMQVGGRVVEVATGEDWQAGWQRAIGAPLGITTIDWQGLGATANYRIAGGARSNLRDYGRVLQMLAADGVGRGRRLLDATALTLLFADRVGTLPIAYAPPNAFADVHYALGSWIEPGPQAPDQATYSSAGAFGFYPWLDRSRRLWGVFMIRGGTGINDQSLPQLQAMVEQLRMLVDAGDCPLIERETHVMVDSFDAPP